MNRKKKIIWGIIIVFGFIAVAGGSVGYYMGSKKVKNFAESKADFVLSAKQLYDEFVANETAATAKYVSNDKTIELKGTITDIRKNDDGSIALILSVGVQDDDISCTLSKAETGKASGLKTGSQVTVKGQCTGLQSLINKEVVMIRCGVE